MSTTTTTTTEDQKTTTTTTQAPTGDEASVNYPGGEASPNAQRQGEIVADQSAPTRVLGDDTPDNALDQNLEQGKQDALVNHERDQANQPESPNLSDSDKKK